MFYEYTMFRKQEKKCEMSAAINTFIYAIYGLLRM